MRVLLLLLLIVPFTIFGQSVRTQAIKQDVAVNHTRDKEFPAEKVISISLEKNSTIAVLENSQLKWNGKSWKSVKSSKAESEIDYPTLPENSGKVLSSVEYNGGFAVGTDNGLYIVSSGEKEWKAVLPQDDKYKWAPYNVAAITVDADGRLWFGAEQGVGRLDGKKWKLFTGQEGLPYNKFTCAAAGKDGAVWFGTEYGAIRAEEDYFFYRAGLRWLPNDYINDITVGDDGTAWIATDKGVSQIIPKQITLDEKAEYFTKQTEDKHQRMGFIAPSNLKEAYKVETSIPGISDNDGKYTSMYGAAHAFRYALTGDEEARELAVRSFDACKWLVDITHEPGFPARVIVPKDWPEPLADPEYSHKMNMNVQKHDPFWKDINPRFVKSKDGKFLWKCDTSSDELAGHYFYYGIYYDLVAKTEEEKKAVREVVADITDHLIRNNYYLRDHDGEATRWGNFSPEYFNSVWGWEQRGLNSMMMLSFLNVAKHVTGDPKYDEAAEYLRETHKYHINAMHSKEYFPPSNVVPWDNNLCLMSFYGLLNYEQDPELLLMYRQSLENAWLHISKQKNSFWDAIYAGLANNFRQKYEDGFFSTGKVFPAAGGFTTKTAKELSVVPDLSSNILESLVRLPLDLIGYTMNNTHRLDVVIDPQPAQKSTVGWRVDGYALPIDERGHVRQDRDGFALDFNEVGGGMAEQEGTFYILPYYMALFHNLIK
jgi:hypothetical protein